MLKNTKLQMLLMLAAGTLLGYCAASGKIPSFKTIAAAPPGAAGAPKGVTSSVSLLYYDYVHMLAEAWTKAGTFDPDKVVIALETLKHNGVASDELSFNAHHQVTHATEVCVAKPNGGDIACSMQNPPAEAPM